MKKVSWSKIHTLMLYLKVTVTLINGLEKSCDNEANLIVFTYFSNTSEHGKTLLIAFNILTLNRKQKSIYLF